MTAIKDDERELWLRRLRFSPELESEFRDDLFRKSIRQWRLFIWIGMSLNIFGALADLGDNHSFSVLLWRFGVLVPVSVACLVFSYRPRFAPYWQLASALLFLCLDVAYFVAADAKLRAIPDLSIAARHNTFLVGICTVIVATFTMSRLRFLWAAMVGYVALAAAIFLIGRDAGASLPDLVRDSQNVFLLVLFAMLGNYTLERLMRTEFLARKMLEHEQARSEALLRNVLPDPVAEQLKTNPGTLAEDHMEATVLFADIVDFTPLAACLPAVELVQLLNKVFTAFDRLADEHGMEKIKTIGDAYMAVAGLPTPHPDHAALAADMALAMQGIICTFPRTDDGEPLEIRIGIHTGPVVAGVIGTKKFIYDLWGDTVNTASRLESQGAPGSILVTAEVYERLQDRYDFGPPRELEIKGQGRRTTYRLIGHRVEQEATEKASVASNTGGIAGVTPLSLTNPATV